LSSVQFLGMVPVRNSLFLVLLLWITLLSMTFPRGHALVNAQMVLDLGRGDDWVGEPTVLHNGTSFAMWFDEMNSTSPMRIGLATSKDGISWSRYLHNPVLGRSRGEGWDSWDVENPWVLYEDGVYKMWYSGDGALSGPNSNMQIGYATSPDGMNWTKYSDNPVLTAGGNTWDDLAVSKPKVVHTGSAYLMYYKGESKESDADTIGLATSKDGTHWTKTMKVTIPSGGWDNGAQVLGGVENLNSSWLIVYASSSSTSSVSIGIATSTDGVKWRPFSDNPIITPGPKGSWDSWAVTSPTAIGVGNDYYIYFDGIGVNAQNMIVGPRIGLAIVSAALVQAPEFPFAQVILITSPAVLVLIKRRQRWDRLSG